MNRWLTWRARLHHLLFDPENECLCATCAQSRVRTSEESRAKNETEKVSDIKCLKKT